MPEVPNPVGLCLCLHPSEVGRSVAATSQPQFICDGPEKWRLRHSEGSLCNYRCPWTKPLPPLHPYATPLGWWCGQPAAGSAALLHLRDMHRAMGWHLRVDHEALCCPNLFILQPFSVLNY